MNLVWHIARKDFARLRWTIALWALVWTASIGFAEIQGHLTDAYYPFLIGAWIFRTIFLPALALGLVMATLSDDSACDDEAFWLTRPIDPRHVATAKLLVLLLLAPLSALLALPWWLYHGYTGLQVGHAAFVLIVRQLTATLLVLPFALLAPTTGRFVSSLILASLGAAAAYATCLWSGLTLTSAQFDRWLAWAAAIWVVTAGIAFLHQYLSRHRQRTVGILTAGGATLLAAFLICRARPSLTIEPSAIGPREIRQTAMLPATAGALCRDDGLSVRVGETIPNDLSGPRVLLQETEPSFDWPSFDEPLRVGRRTGRAATYFLIDLRDGSWASASATPDGAAITVATMHYSRWLLLAVRTARGRTDDPNLDFPAWAKEATVVKFSSDQVLNEPPSSSLARRGAASP